MRKELLLLVAATAAAALIGLALVRLLAPGLLGVAPTDLQLVQVSDSIPPFFDNVFRDEDYDAGGYLVRDPYLKRALPLLNDQRVLGPHDILGFRNRCVPNSVDVLAVGDSQTYGNGAPIDSTWPSQLRDRLTNDSAIVYNASVGGWGAVEYLQIFDKLRRLRPAVLIVAFYTGNDPLESFVQAYGRERWRPLRPNARLTAGDAPPIVFPPPADEIWGARFDDGVTVGFTPRYRLASNNEHPAVSAGYDVMAEAARQLGVAAADAGARLVFTIIPTKELVFAPRVTAEGLDAPEAYDTLVTREAENIARLSRALEAVPGATYVDVVRALQRAARLPTPLYPASEDGHPLAHGYGVIAAALADALD